MTRHLLIAALSVCSAAHAQRPDFMRIPPGSLGKVRFEQPFWAGKTEVTVRQFAAFVEATGYRTTAERLNSPRTWRTPGSFKVSGNQPVVQVTSGDAAAYCQWIGARLPTDAEWEYAARAGATTRHFWGDTMDERYLWYRPNTDSRPHAVGKKRPNAWGLHDVEGNVWEWSVSEVNGEPAANRRGGSWASCEYSDGAPGKFPPHGIEPTPRMDISKGYKVLAKDADLSRDDIGFRCVRSGP